jgi:CTP:molybdopterin cytidylyltransferase MocA
MHFCASAAWWAVPPDRAAAGPLGTMLCVTVAAVILTPDPDAALADADGVAAVRRIVDGAWAGGALPIVVVAADPDGRIGAVLAGTAVTLAEPGPDDGSGGDDVRRGIEVAVSQIREIDGALAWPVRLAWVGPETVTSLIEAHGAMPGTILRPSYESEPGWPVLVPLAHLDALLGLVPAGGGAGAMIDALAEALDASDLPSRVIELGDPGTVFDVTVPRVALPPYVGPTEPASGHVHEWGAAVAQTTEEGPIQGPALAPWGQAAAPDPDQPG